jgi:formylglycine-generating enzyme
MKLKTISLLIFLAIYAFSQAQEAVEKPVIDWVVIPGGTFTMGASKKEMKKYATEAEFTEEQHEVTLSPFRISKYEITFEQYDMFCKATDRKLPFDEGWGRGKHPVINVSYLDAVAFANWLGYRLPTEAEWEYACRAGTTTTFYTGECLNTTQANFKCEAEYDCCGKYDCRRMTMPVGSFEPNAWGLYDMYGNVEEWCSDWYSYYRVNPQTDPKGATGGRQRVVRGGSWTSSLNYCRSAARNNQPVYLPTSTSVEKVPFIANFLGFRLVEK